MKSKGKATLIMAYCLEKKTVQKKGKSFKAIWQRYATCGSHELLERVRLGQERPEHWRVVLENVSLKKAG
nr:hypothetical protein [uncultured Oscillibacter sp.]